MKRTTILRITRWIILLSVLVLTTVMGRLHQMIKLYPPVDAFCPFGGLESLWALLRYGALLKKIAWSSFILLGASVITALAFRRSFCGNICPLGFLQEIFGLGGKSLLGRRFNIPGKVDRWLRYGKYLVFIIITVWTWKELTLVIQPYDPWLAYQHLGTEDLFSKYLAGTVVLFAALGLSVFIDRPFCRYLCPMGGMLGAISKIGAVKIRRNTESCIECGICDRSCPVSLKPSQEEFMASAECLNCSECVNSCPVENTLTYVLPGKKKRRLSTAVVLLGTVAIFTVLIAVTTFTKLFIWKTDTGLEYKVERLLAGPGRIGSDNTMMDIIQIYRINPAYLGEQFGLSGEDDFLKTLKELGIDPRDVSETVTALYEEAGLDATRLLGGGGGGGRGHGGGSH